MTATLLETNAIYKSLTDLSTCLCSEILDPDNGVPDVCFCGVIPGEAASAMYGGNCKTKCGMAWVRLMTAYPAPGPGQQGAITPGNCATGIGYEVEVGMLRCTPVGTADTPPKDAELLAAAQLQYADMMVMRKAIACCASKDWALTAYNPAGPSGGLVGGFWSVAMWVP